MSRIISVHAFKGGSGKTTITANLAARLAAGGSRVGIIDADFRAPGMRVLLGLPAPRPQRTLNHYLWHEAELEEVIYPAPMDNLPGQIILIPASGTLEDIRRMSKEGYDTGLLHNGIKALTTQERLDFLLVDTQPGVEENTLLMAVSSDLLLITACPDYQDLNGTRLLMQAIYRLAEPQIALLVNKTSPTSQPERLRKIAREHLDLDILSILPLADAIIEKAGRSLFVLEHPDHPWSQAIDDLAEHLLALRA